MTQTDLPWTRLEKDFSSAMETLGALEAAARLSPAADALREIEDVRHRASEVAKWLHRDAPRDVLSNWKAWVSAETAWLEFRLEMHRLASKAGSLRQAFLASLAHHMGLLEQEIGKLLAQSGRFRPRTRIAIAREVERLRRRLEALRADVLRLEESTAASDPETIRGIGDAWSDTSWAVESTKKRYSRPRWRQGRDSPVLSTPV